MATFDRDSYNVIVSLGAQYDLNNLIVLVDSDDETENDIASLDPDEAGGKEVISLDSDNNENDVVSLELESDIGNVSIGDPDFRILSADEFRNLGSRSAREEMDFRASCRLQSSQICRSPQGLHLVVGMCVELKDRDFLFIERIVPVSCSSTASRIRGILLRRNRRLRHLLQAHRNEVSAILDSTGGSSDPSIRGSSVIRSAADVSAVRELIVTNAPYPAFCSPRADYDGRAHFESDARIVCRHKYIDYKRIGRKHDGAIIALTEDDVDSVRGRTMPNIERNVIWTSPETFDLTTAGDVCSIPFLLRLRSGRKQYTWADICSGGGGASSAADRLGLKINFAVDHDEDACRTFRRNFPGANVICKSIFEFLQGSGFRVDILHISFPCQTFSRAHTVPGRNDDANSAVWSALGPIIEHCRPRTLVLEQADGICDERHRPTLDAWIRELTSKGYSARWSILNAARWGNAHARKRLFIIASCPGEPLPAFPRPTHGAGPPLLPWVTIADRLRLLPAHQEPHMRQHRPRGGRPYTPHRPLAQCITTGGGKGDLHPDGTRTFTAQELALLNGFPPGHLFAAAGLGSLRRQIGNAVPSMVERAVLDEVIGSMRRFDEKVAAWRPEDDVMVID